MTTQYQKQEKSIPQSSVSTKDVISMNGLPLTDTTPIIDVDTSDPVFVGIDIGIEKDSSFLAIIVDGMYFFEPL